MIIAFIYGVEEIIFAASYLTEKTFRYPFDGYGGGYVLASAKASSHYYFSFPFVVIRFSTESAAPGVDECITATITTVDIFFTRRWFVNLATLLGDSMSIVRRFTVQTGIRAILGR